MKILIAYGGTSEKIDSVRYITNISSGLTGHTIASELKTKFEVDTIAATRAPLFADTKTFVSFDDLYNETKNALSSTHYDYVIYAAAVSDYLIKKIEADTDLKSSGKKIQSNQNLNIQLKPSFKIIDKIKQLSCNKKVKLIGFKLTDTNNSSEILLAIKKVLNSGADYVVHNDLSKINSEQHEGHIFNKQTESICAFKNKLELAQSIKKIIEEDL